MVVVGGKGQKADWLETLITAFNATKPPAYPARSPQASIYTQRQTAVAHESLRRYRMCDTSTDCVRTLFFKLPITLLCFSRRRKTINTTWLLNKGVDSLSYSAACCIQWLRSTLARSVIGIRVDMI